MHEVLFLHSHHFKCGKIDRLIVANCVYAIYDLLV